MRVRRRGRTDRRGPDRGCGRARGAVASSVPWPPSGEAVPSISVVEPALAAAALGASAMHDPTEGGLAAGLHEIAEASGVAIVVDRSEVAWYPPAVAVVEAAGANPWSTLASGTVLATFGPTRPTPRSASSGASVTLRRSSVRPGRAGASPTSRARRSRGPTGTRSPGCSRVTTAHIRP